MSAICANTQRGPRTFRTASGPRSESPSRTRAPPCCSPQGPAYHPRREIFPTVPATLGRSRHVMKKMAQRTRTQRRTQRRRIVECASSSERRRKPIAARHNTAVPIPGFGDVRHGGARHASGRLTDTKVPPMRLANFFRLNHLAQCGCYKNNGPTQREVTLRPGDEGPPICWVITSRTCRTCRSALWIWKREESRSRAGGR